MPLRSVCVFCASSPGQGDRYLATARETGRLLASRGIELVYGGASVGMMGALADAALAAGGRVTGVIPRSLVDREIAHGGLTRLEVVGSMHERKARMAELSDAFIALPGGFGTLDELCEIVTWAQIGLHRKPFGVVNTAGYWDGFLSFLDHGVAEGLIRPVNRASLLLGGTPAELLAAFAR